MFIGVAVLDIVLIQTDKMTLLSRKGIHYCMAEHTVGFDQGGDKTSLI